MPVEITGGWVRAEIGIGGRIVLGWFVPGPFEQTQGRAADRLTVRRVQGAASSWVSRVRVLIYLFPNSCPLSITLSAKNRPSTIEYR